jgi:hypothetical protein
VFELVPLPEPELIRSAIGDDRIDFCASGKKIIGKPNGGVTSIQYAACSENWIGTAVAADEEHQRQRLLVLHEHWQINDNGGTGSCHSNQFLRMYKDAADAVAFTCTAVQRTCLA